MKLIDADVLIKEIASIPDWRKLNIKMIGEAIGRVPEVKPGPKKGVWISEKRHHANTDEEFYYIYTYCSVCKIHKRISWFDANYCPNCGADMRSNDVVGNL